MAKYPYSWPALRGRKAQDMQKMLGDFYFFLCFGTNVLLFAGLPRLEHTRLKQLNQVRQQLTYMRLPFGVFSLWWWVVCAVVSLFGEIHTCCHLFEGFGKRKADDFNVMAFEEGFKANIPSVTGCQVQGSLCIAIGMGWIYTTTPLEGLTEVSPLAGVLCVFKIGFLWMFQPPALHTVSPGHLHIEK